MDYGIGNLRSVEKALAAAGAQVELTSDPAVMLAAEKVVLPGVGAFGDGMDGLRIRNLIEPPQEMTTIGSPFAMQFMFEALEKVGAYDTILQSIGTKFDGMIQSGATTVWEMFAESDFAPRAAHLGCVIGLVGPTVAQKAANVNP